MTTQEEIPTVIKGYFGVSSNNPCFYRSKIDPNMLGFESDKYYYCYKAERVNNILVVEDMDAKLSNLRKLGLGEPGFFTLN